MHICVQHSAKDNSQDIEKDDCLVTDEWMKKLLHIHTMTVRRGEMLQFAIPEMDTT